MSPEVDSEVGLWNAVHCTEYEDSSTESLLYFD